MRLVLGTRRAHAPGREQKKQGDACKKRADPFCVTTTRRGYRKTSHGTEPNVASDAQASDAGWLPALGHAPASEIGGITQCNMPWGALC
jgi:hypothetical protein